MRVYNNSNSYITLSDKVSILPFTEQVISDEIAALGTTQYWMERGVIINLSAGGIIPVAKPANPGTIQDSVVSGTLEESGIKMEKALSISDLVDRDNNIEPGDQSTLEKITIDIDNDDATRNDELDEIDAEHIINEDTKALVKKTTPPPSKNANLEIHRDQHSFVKKNPMNAVGAIEITHDEEVANLDRAAQKLKSDLQEIMIDEESNDEEVTRFIALGDYEKKKYIINCTDPELLRRIHAKIEDKIAKDLIIQRLKELE